MHSVRRTGGPGRSRTDDRDLREQPAAVRTRRMFSRKRKFTAGLLAAICPGLGHVYLGLYRKGVAFMFTLLLDASALLYFSSIGMQINVPLLILLALVIPVAYFYNVYDVLQAADFVILRRAQTSDKDNGEVEAYRNPFSVERGPFFGIMLIVGGALMFAFYQKPGWLQFYIEHYSKITVAAVLIAAGLWAGIREVWILWKQRRSEQSREGER
ncbi:MULTISPECIES: hypothetical protein [Paenibacillus]|uniref:Uncharacterized protein n=1 Tax=Paenibacillus azoreducens TaxID=116718 RepID=A0A920CP72_9BACL|nr:MULTISPECIES: hypothetical protein [Paenibacillus]MBE9918385.1 hypothetical protein [Paenibacillus donghaensis]GIO48311.1 hypothetical protein J34TS1_30760 [Paenibacillus azoreducens]